MSPRLKIKIEKKTKLQPAQWSLSWAGSLSKTLWRFVESERVIEESALSLQMDHYNRSLSSAYRHTLHRCRTDFVISWCQRIYAFHKVVLLLAWTQTHTHSVTTHILCRWLLKICRQTSSALFNLEVHPVIILQTSVTLFHITHIFFSLLLLSPLLFLHLNVQSRCESPTFLFASRTQPAIVFIFYSFNSVTPQCQWCCVVCFTPTAVQGHVRNSHHPLNKPETSKSTLTDWWMDGAPKATRHITVCPVQLFSA